MEQIIATVARGPARRKSEKLNALAVDRSHEKRALRPFGFM
jgi:hypothetical protein